VIDHPTIKVIIDQCIGNVDFCSEDQISKKLVGDGLGIEFRSELEEGKFAILYVNVLVKFTIYHDPSIRILPQDVFDYVCYPH
jgi:hypothetical protein